MVTEKQPVTYNLHPFVWRILKVCFFSRISVISPILPGLDLLERLFHPGPCQTAKSVAKHRVAFSLPTTWQFCRKWPFLGWWVVTWPEINGCELSDLQGMWMKSGHFCLKNHRNHLVDVNKNSCWKTAWDQKYPEHVPPSAVFEWHTFLVILATPRVFANLSWPRNRRNTKGTAFVELVHPSAVLSCLQLCVLLLLKKDRRSFLGRVPKFDRVRKSRPKQVNSSCHPSIKGKFFPVNVLMIWHGEFCVNIGILGLA